MNVLVVEPDFAPYEKEINGLSQMQETVGGLIQAIYPFNRSMEGGYGGVFGTFFVCGLGEEDFCSLTPGQIETYKKKFHCAEILLGTRGNDLVTLKVRPKQKPVPGTPNRVPKPPER